MPRARSLARARILEAIQPGEVADRILKAHGESTTPPLRAPARDPPQKELWGRTRSPDGPAPEPACDVDQRVPGEDADQTEHFAA